LDQTARKINLAKFRNGKTKVLIVTDVASRGIDVPLLENVINFDFPPTPKLFVHRVGRAARAGRPGFAYSFLSQDEVLNVSFSCFTEPVTPNSFPSIGKLPYLMDLQLFLGRPLVTKFTPEPDLKSVLALGTVPRGILEQPIEEVASLRKNHVEIVGFYIFTLPICFDYSSLMHFPASFSLMLKRWSTTQLNFTTKPDPMLLQSPTQEPGAFMTIPFLFITF